jgi:hypothetical protein
LPSARHPALGKETFVDRFFAECSLPSAALGKGFAECKWGFAECPRHSAKSLFPVVKSSKVKTTWDQEPTISLSAINLWVFRKAHI